MPRPARADSPGPCAVQPGPLQVDYSKKSLESQMLSDSAPGQK